MAGRAASRLRGCLLQAAPGPLPPPVPGQPAAAPTRALQGQGTRQTARWARGCVSEAEALRSELTPRCARMLGAGIFVRAGSIKCAAPKSSRLLLSSPSPSGFLRELPCPLPWLLHGSQRSARPPAAPLPLCPAVLPPRAPRSRKTLGEDNVAVVAVFPVMFPSFPGQKEKIRTPPGPGLLGVPEVDSHQLSRPAASRAELGCSPAPLSGAGAWPHSQPRGLHRWHRPSPRRQPGLHQLPRTAGSRSPRFLVQTLGPPCSPLRGSPPPRRVVCSHLASRPRGCRALEGRGLASLSKPQVPRPAAAGVTGPGSGCPEHYRSALRSAQTS